MKLSELTRDKRILIQGGSGTGKTHIVGTLCKLVPTLLITSDKEGLETLASEGLDPEVVYIEDWKNCWDYYTEIVKLASNFKTLAIDDFGATQTIARHKVERMPRGTKEEQDKQFATTVRRELMRGERIMELRDWGKMWIAMETFLYSILDLPPAIKLVTVLEDVAENPRDGKEHLTVSLSGQLRRTLPARFSLVAEAAIYHIDDKTQYVLHCCSHPKIDTKSRYGKGRVWINPTMAQVLAYINNKGEPMTQAEEKIHGLLGGY